VGPTPRRAGRYWGSCAGAGVADGEPDGRAEDVAAGFVAGEADGFEEAGVAVGFVCTSAAKGVSTATRTTVRANQNLSIECLRNALLALSQDQYWLAGPLIRDLPYFLWDFFPGELSWTGGLWTERGRFAGRFDWTGRVTFRSCGAGLGVCCWRAVATFGLSGGICTAEGVPLSTGTSLRWPLACECNVGP
jgi:hypothetical protein